MKKQFIFVGIILLIIIVALLVSGIIIANHYFNSSSDKKNGEQIAVSLTGECGNAGNETSSNLFKNNPCKLINTKTSAEIVRFVDDKSTEEDCKSKMCITEFSMVALMGQTNDIQNVLIYGSEGGGNWYSVYSVNLKDKTVKLEYKAELDLAGVSTEFPSYDINRVDTIECIDPSLDSYYSENCLQNWTKLSAKDKASFQKWVTNYKAGSMKYYLGEKKYNLYYYFLLNVNIGVYFDIGEKVHMCDSSYAGNCVLRLQVKDTPECKDLIKVTAYSKDCFTNWNTFPSALEERITLQEFQSIIEGINKYGYPIPGATHAAEYSVR